MLFTAAAAAGVFSQATSSLLVAIVTLSMALTPVAAMLSRRLMHKQDELAEEIEEDFEGAGAGADVLMIGFSRFAQIASQILLAGGRDVTIIDHSAARVRQAATFGFRIYFGDGTRLDVLRAAGIEKAKIVAVCTQKRRSRTRSSISSMPNTRMPASSRAPTTACTRWNCARGGRLRTARDVRVGSAFRPQDARGARRERR